MRVSLVGLGGSPFGRQCDAAQTARIVHRALDAGVTFIDTADVYAAGDSERFVGKALAGRRHHAVVATKVFGRTRDLPNDAGLSRKHIVEAVEGSLRRLDTDYVDLYQLHQVDTSTPIDETLSALDSLVRQGKVRYIGCSNFAAWQICEALWASDRRNLTPLVSVQPRYNLLERDIEHELVPFCRRHGIGIIPYGPLASGILTGKYKEGEAPPPGSRFAGAPALRHQLTAERLRAVERLGAWAAARGRTVAQLAIAWLCAHQEVSTVIAGATSVAQMEENAAAADWTLAPEELREVETHATPARRSS
jgi:aryl-alcohol dehydrogenase-like predicted oxidoreductase